MVILFTENGYNSFLSLAKLIKSNIKSHHMGNHMHICSQVS